jgi:hypothetical protein
MKRRMDKLRKLMERTRKQVQKGAGIPKRGKESRI